MAQRAIALRYFGERINEEGFIELTITAAYVDTLNIVPAGIYGPVAKLNPATPATWNADVKAAMQETGVAVGFTSILTTDCFAPQYA